MSPPAAVSPPWKASATSGKVDTSITVIDGWLDSGNELSDDLCIETLHTLYQRGATTPVAVVRSVYERIAAYSDKAVWITLVPQEEAVRRAERLQHLADTEAQQQALFGIPFSVKDSIDVAGMPTTLACPSFAYTALTTAPVVQRILDAGGILIGKTNLDQFATGLNGTRSPYGIPRCVHDPDYVSGGSSSGSVVSVAANLVSFTVATDTAGSTRVPAALNGMVGLKPTLGTISTVGLVPACKTADCITIIARTVESTVAALDVMQAYDEDDVYAREPQQLAMLVQQEAALSKPLEPNTSLSPSSKTSTARNLRIGLPPQELLDSVLSPEYARLFERFTARLADLDIHVASEFDYAPFASANAMLYGSSIVAQRIVAFKDYLDRHGHDQLHPVIREIFESSAGFDAVRAYQDIFDLASFRRLAAKQFRRGSGGGSDGIDVLVVPSTATHPTVEEMLADPINLNKRLGSFSHFVNLLDLCAVSIPVTGATWKSRRLGRDMPFGITLISLPGSDRRLLQLCQHLRNMRV
ncbi:allophanate hydrolase [Exophiala spinifera]|uniref:Allophanate hydrolase n=1 Tax=Exophiala spinifera TaxID=91928 RepID=A0A0D2BMI3_9EURO|nr:allophanate hydrolase [Exophiala spinifera]KIW19795.1 allophanate hydrolase [Exophiala spinifera]